MGTADVLMSKVGELHGDADGPVELWNGDTTDENGGILHTFTGMDKIDYRVLSIGVTIRNVATEITIGVEAALGLFQVRTPSGLAAIMIPISVTQFGTANWVIQHIPGYDVIVPGRRGYEMRYENAELDTNGTPTMDLSYFMALQRV